MKGKKGFQKGNKLRLGKVVTQETKDKISLSNTGKLRTEEQRKRLSLAKIGTKTSDKTKKKLSQIALEKGFGKWMTGKKHTIETRKKMSNSKLGEKAQNWKGGITPINHKIRESLEYRLWRESVFARDNYTCVICKIRGTKLNADHIKQFALFPELRFDINNGRTLCIPCHKKTNTYMKPIKKLLENEAKNIH